jgi:hypothetical protein
MGGLSVVYTLFTFLEWMNHDHVHFFWGLFRNLRRGWWSFLVRLPRAEESTYRGAGLRIDLNLAASLLSDPAVILVKFSLYRYNNPSLSKRQDTLPLCAVQVFLRTRRELETTPFWSSTTSIECYHMKRDLHIQVELHAILRVSPRWPWQRLSVP